MKMLCNEQKMFCNDNKMLCNERIRVMKDSSFIASFGIFFSITKQLFCFFSLKRDLTFENRLTKEMYTERDLHIRHSGLGPIKRRDILRPVSINVSLYK